MLILCRISSFPFKVKLYLRLDRTISPWLTTQSGIQSGLSVCLESGFR